MSHPLTEEILKEFNEEIVIQDGGMAFCPVRQTRDFLLSSLTRVREATVEEVVKRNERSLVRNAKGEADLSSQYNLGILEAIAGALNIVNQPLD